PGDGPAQSVLDRGPQIVRHRHRAVGAADYEQLALEASPGVAVARAVTPARAPGLVPAGNVRVIVVPRADETEPRPEPTRELRDQVRDYLRARSPAPLAGRIEVVGPN